MNEIIIKEFLQNATLERNLLRRYNSHIDDGIVFCDVCDKKPLTKGYGWSDYDMCIQCYNENKKSLMSTSTKPPVNKPDSDSCNNFSSTHHEPKPKHRDINTDVINTWFRPPALQDVCNDRFDMVAGNTRINNEKGIQCDEMTEHMNNILIADKEIEECDYADYANTRHQKFVPDDEY